MQEIIAFNLQGNNWIRQNIDAMLKNSRNFIQFVVLFKLQHTFFKKNNTKAKLVYLVNIN